MKIQFHYRIMENSVKMGEQEKLFPTRQILWLYDEAYLRFNRADDLLINFNAIIVFYSNKSSQRKKLRAPNMPHQPSNLWMCMRWLQSIIMCNNNAGERNKNE